jgi:hypothetical protein
MADSKDSLDERVLAAAFGGEAPKQDEPIQSEPFAPEPSQEDSLDQKVLSAAFKAQAPSDQPIPNQPSTLLGSTGNTLSTGGEFMLPKQPGTIGSGVLGSGQFAPSPVREDDRFDKYAGVTDPAMRKGIIESDLKHITDPRELKKIKEKIPWYNIAENPLQTDSLFLHEWNESTGLVDAIQGAAKAGMGMLESLPPLAAGAGRLAKDAFGAAIYAGDPSAFGKGRTLTEEQKQGMTEQQVRDAELSDRDKLIRSSRAFGDTALEAEEQLRKAVSNFAENKSMLYDKARVGFATAAATLSDPSVTEPYTIEEEKARREAARAKAMEDARSNFAKRLNAKHVEHMQKEKNPAILARDLEAVWQYPAVKNFATNVMELMLPPAEDYAPGFGGDINAANAARTADAAGAADAGVQAAIAESNRLREDPEQTGAIAMVTPLNVVGMGGMALGAFGKANQALIRGLKAVGKTDQEINAIYSAESAALQARRAQEALTREQPGRLETALGNIADTTDKAKAAFENIPKPVKYAGAALLGAGAGALASNDPLTGALEGAGAGAGIQLGGKALLSAPRLGQQLAKAGRMAGAEMGRFEALGKMESASPEVQRFLKWSQKAGGGKALDFIEKNANVFVQHNVQMLPMMVALGVLEDKDAKELAQMWAEFATYGFIHGQVLGGMLGNDPVRIKMDRDAQMRQAQRAMLSMSPETRENVTNLNWDQVINQSEKRLKRAQKAYFAEMAKGANTPEAAEAKSDYEFAHQLHRQNLIAPPEARQAFEDNIKLSLGKVSNLINGVLTPNSNMNIELLTTDQIINKMISANPNYNGVGAPMTVEQALERNPTADGAKISKGIDEKGFMMDPAKDTVFVNIDNALKKAELSGQAISNVLAHEAVGHGLFGKEQYRHKIAPLFNMMFGTEVQDENGNWREITPAQPGLSREDLFEKFFNKYLKNKDPEEVARYAEAAGVWDKQNNTFDKNKVVELMREEALAEAHAGQFFGDPESPAQSGLSWLASRVSSQNVKSALNHLYAIAGPAVYKQWASGAVGATYSPDVMRAIRNVENEMRKYDGDFLDAVEGDPVKAPITPKDAKKSPELLEKYFKDSGKFETSPVAVVTDADGKVIQTVDLKNTDAPEGSWIYHQDDATGDNVPNKEKGHGDLPPELTQIQVPPGGRIKVERKISYDEATGKPKERKNKETVEFLKKRVQILRDAIDNAGDPSEIGRFKAIPSKSGEGDEEGDMRYTGKLTKEQREAIAALPESIVPASMKDLLFKYDDMLTRDDGTVLDIDYAARLNAKGNYEAFSPRIRQVVPLRLHLSKDGNFYVKAWDLSALRKKVELYKKYAPGVFEPWGGDTEAFWREFRTKLLPKLAEKPDIEKIRADISKGFDAAAFQGPAKEQFDQKVAEEYARRLNEPAWTALEGDPETQRLKRTIYAKMIGDPNPNVPDVENIPDIPKEKLSRSEKKIDKKSPLAQIIKSYRLDAHTAAEENANTEFKYPIPYKARFMPEQEAPKEEQRPELKGGILKGLQAVSAKYSPTGTGEIKATVQPAAEIVSPTAQAPETLLAPIDQIYDTTTTRVPAGDGGRGRALREYTPLKGAPTVEGATGPDPRINAAAEQYAQSRGIPVRRQGEYVMVDSERAKRIADAYAAMPHAPNDPAVREAYADMIRQTRDQYDALTDAGFKFWFTDPENDPYEGKPWRAMRDLRQNQSMGVFPTEAGFGSGETEFKVADNPLLADTGLMWPYGSPDGPLKRVTANDLFRAVHDAFGHGLEGAGFRAEGEENAWQAHSRLFTGKALGAMTSETRGQNSWLNYGPHGEKNKNAKVEDTVFADQKTGLMPEWTWKEGVARDEVYPEGAQTRFMPNVAVVPERFTGTGEEEQRRGRYVEPPKFFNKFNISQYEKGGKFFDAETGEDLTNKTYENASIAVINGKPSLVANNEAETTGTGPLFRTNLFKQKAGWKWVSEDAPDTSTIVSVEGQGKHLYALQADFQNGVKMARYEDKASEPRLRPTGRGELMLGEQVGTIDIRGKQHPVYDKVTIGEAPEAERPTRGININDKSQDFTDQILRGEKTIETRDQSKSLAPYVGKRVGIISTGKGPATLKGYADIGEPIEYRTPEEFRAAEEQHRVPEGSPFDIKPGQSKFGFPLSNIEPILDPKRVPVSGRVASDLSNIRFSPDQEQEPVRRMPMSAVDVLHSDSTILPKPIKKQSNAQIAIQLADVAERYHGQKITSSNITPEIESELVVNGANEAEAALKASGKNAANWYSTAIQAALKVAGIIHNVLTDLNVAKANQFFAKEPDPLEAANFALRLPLAITSQNMTVPLNARFAEEQFNTFQQTGKFDPSKKYGGKAKSISANLNLANEMIDKLGGIIELQKFVKQEFTVIELESAVSQLMGKKISISGRKDDMVNGAAIFGPKIGQGFLQNLMGKFDPVTIDLWMRRTWGRWTGDVVGDGVTGVRLGRMIQAFRDAGKQLPESIRRLKTVTRSPGVTETGKAKKPELTVTESVEDRIESDPEFRKDLERIAKETDAEFQKHYALMSAPMSEKLAKEIRAAMPMDPAAPTQSELEALDKAYRKAVKVQSEVAKSMDEKFSDLTTDQKKALNPEDPKTAIKKDAWIAMEHSKEGRTEKLENPEKNLLKPEWAKAAKVIVAELNPIDIPSDQDRMVISRVVNKIRETLERRGYTVTNADVQAILWYPEKDLWAKLAGKKESNLKQSYDDEFIKIAEQRGLGERARAVARDVRGY